MEHIPAPDAVSAADEVMDPIQNTTRRQPREHDRAIRDMFAGIAGVYDRMNGVLSLGRDAAWRRDLAGEIDPSAQELLDVCCGTGELLLTAKRMGRGSRHLAMDFCLPMLQAGVRDHDLGRECGLAAADTQRLPLADAGFDAVMVAFGLRNLGQLELGLRELARVLRPGGQLLVLEFFRPRRGWVGAPLQWYLERVVPFLGRIVGRDEGAYTYLPRSMARFLTVSEFQERLEGAGFEGRMLVRRQTFGVAHLVVARKR
jgi:demethylmenaquinone methyltransferase/2-methoxy-6-polyprenyl-1,4-benzoquinol methylase